MSNTIGLRFYKVTFHEERNSSTIDTDDARLWHGDKHLVSEFMTKHTTVTNVDDAQRGWFFDKPKNTNERDVTGRITYGIHGIVSRFVDVVSRHEKFKRTAVDLEEIPLFFQIFRPKGEHYIIFVFQSYGVRSCIFLVQKAFREYIKSKADLTVRFRKLMPAEAGIDPFSAGLVKEMTLFKRKVSSDKVDAYRDDAPGEYDVKLSLVAKGKTNFGFYRNLTSKKIKDAGHSVASFDEFDKATVRVKLGNNSKHITVFGDQGEAGTIDVTDDELLKTADGHPTEESLKNIAKPILKHFNNALIGYRK